MIEVAELATDGRLIWWCPGCQEHHGVPTTGPKAWGFNGSLEKPTLTPSVLVRGVKQITDDEHKRIMEGETIEPVKMVCHIFMREGKIEFLGDCSHELAGQTVDMGKVE